MLFLITIPNVTKQCSHFEEYFSIPYTVKHAHSSPQIAMLSHFSHVRLCATPETAAHQAPPSLGFSRQEHWSGLPFPSPTHESEKWKWSRSVVSDPQRPHGLQPSRLLHPWDFPGKSTGVGCHCLLRDYTLDICRSEMKTAITPKFIGADLWQHCSPSHKTANYPNGQTMLCADNRIPLLFSCYVMSDSFVAPWTVAPPGSSVHGISQARVLEWIAISFSKRSSWPRDGTHVSCIDRRILYHWAIREA